jgi:hypothetical protein
MTKRTILSHFYNEEYLLPWWLNHHKKYFDHGILVDYNSNDRSRGIIKDICPTWDIIESKNECFDSKSVDDEIVEIEKNIEGWRICLNTTEFILGDFSALNNLDSDVFVKSFIMVDRLDFEFKDPIYDIPLFIQRSHGIYTRPELGGPISRKTALRRMSKDSKDYGAPGRHFFGKYSNDFIILWYGYSPFTEGFLERKIQIGNRLSNMDKEIGNGRHHLMNIDEHVSLLREYQTESEDLLPNYIKYLNL